MAEKPVIPNEIGGYQITGILGEGGMSVVYTALQKHPKRTVAIKVLRGGLYSPTAAKRFHLEVEILGKLDHPWIAKIYDAGSHDDGNGATPYYVMEHVGGARELTQYIEDEKLERRELLKLFTMITSAVEHGHHRGIVHRDLKPGNILIDTNGEPKIIDFGVARSLDSDKVNNEAMTEAGRLVGTVQFMAPEQVDAKISDIDARCDVYALGAVLYQMLTTRLPRTLEGLPIYEAVRQICLGESVRPTVYDDTIDQDLEAIIMKAIESDRGKRYQTAGAFGRDMLRYLGHRPIKARKVTALDRSKLFYRRHKKQLMIWAVVSFVGALAVVGGIYFKNKFDVRQKEMLTTIEELSKKNDALEVAPPTPTTKSLVDTFLPPIFTLPSTPEEVRVSANGNTIVAVVDDSFVAYSNDGTEIPVPPMNVVPSNAVFAVSNSGARAIFVSQNAYEVNFATTPPTRNNVVIQGEPVSVFIEKNIIASINQGGALLISVDGIPMRPATSTTGNYEMVSIASGGNQIVGATDDWIYIWETQHFPTQPRKMRGVPEPIFVGSFLNRTVVVGKNGLVFVHECIEGIDKQVSTIRLGVPIDQCAMNPDASLVVYVSEGKAYTCQLDTGALQEQLWMHEITVGVSVDKNNRVLLWTEEGAFYQSGEH